MKEFANSCSAHISSVFSQKLGIYNKEMRNATPISTYKVREAPYEN